MTNLRDLLKNIYLFKTFTDQELATIAGLAKKKDVGSGARVFYENGAADAMYVIEYGTIQFLRKNSEGDLQQIRTLGRGAHFGELPLLDGEKRFLTAEATENSVLYEIPYDTLKAALAGDTKMAADFYRAIAHFLVVSLRTATRDLTVAREIQARHL